MIKRLQKRQCGYGVPVPHSVCVKYMLCDLLRSCGSMTSSFYFLNLFISKQLKELGLNRSIRAV